LQAARAKARHTKSKQPLERSLKPKDVPGTLTNMALLNLASEDPDLRLASYNLLCALSLVFNFEMNNQLLPVETLAIPTNIANFITKMSENLAVSEPQLTLEFIRECLMGFTKSEGRAKQLCLEYLSPWLSNLDSVYGGDVAETEMRIGEILRLLLEITVKETEVSNVNFVYSHINGNTASIDLSTLTVKSLESPGKYRRDC
jgi:neurofibromin 1